MEWIRIQMFFIRKCTFYNEYNCSWVFQTFLNHKELWITDSFCDFNFSSRLLLLLLLTKGNPWFIERTHCVFISLHFGARNLHICCRKLIKQHIVPKIMIFRFLPYKYDNDNKDDHSISVISKTPYSTVSQRPLSGDKGQEIETTNKTNIGLV